MTKIFVTVEVNGCDVIRVCVCIYDRSMFRSYTLCFMLQNYILHWIAG